MNILKTSMALLLLSCSATSYAGTIDLFTTFQFAGDDENTLANTSTTAKSYTSDFGGSILGVERDFSVNAISGATDDFVNVGSPAGDGFNVAQGSLGTTMVATGGKLNFVNDPGVVGIATVQWDGIDGSSILDKTGLGGANVKLDGSTGFLVTILESDQAFEFQLNVYTDATHFTEVTISSTIVLAGAPLERFIPFADLENSALCGLGGFNQIESVVCGAGGNVDFGNLGAMELKFNTANVKTAALDLQIASITTEKVPEPSVLMLLSAGLFSAGFMSRKKQK